MVKDRLKEMKVLREQGSQEDFDTSQDPSNHEFFKQIEVIRHDLTSLETNIDQAKTVQNRILSEPLSREKLQSDLSDLKQAIKKKASQIRDKLNRLENESSGENASTTGRIQKTVLSATVHTFVEMMQNYNSLQVQHQEKIISQIQRMREIGAVDPSGEHIIGNELQQAQLAKQQLNDLEARFTHFIQIEDSIKEMHDMFLDMNMIVESQGEIIDRIETHVQGAELDVERATEQTRLAGHYQSMARRKKCCLIICGLVTLLILIVAILLAIFL